MQWTPALALQICWDASLKGPYHEKLSFPILMGTFWCGVRDTIMQLCHNVFRFTICIIDMLFFCGLMNCDRRERTSRLFKNTVKYYQIRCTTLHLMTVISLIWCAQYSLLKCQNSSHCVLRCKSSLLWLGCDVTSISTLPYGHPLSLQQSSHSFMWCSVVQRLNVLFLAVGKQMYHCKLHKR